MSSISQQIISLAKERVHCDTIDLRNCTVPSTLSENKPKKIVEQRKEKDEEPKSKPPEVEISSKITERGETLDKFIDKDSPFRRTKN